MVKRNWKYWYVIFFIRRKLMKKLIITMIAITFSFSAYSEIYLIEKNESIGVWCVNTYVFVGHSGALVQLYSRTENKPLSCKIYEKYKK